MTCLNNLEKTMLCRLLRLGLAISSFCFHMLVDSFLDASCWVRERLTWGSHALGRKRNGTK